MTASLATDDDLPVVRAVDLDDGDARPRWLVEPLWARAAVGVLGGAPKCCKSWLALDLAVSVSSGTACLGVFDVADAGPVLLYMAEDSAPVVKARLRGICRARGLDLATIPIYDKLHVCTKAEAVMAAMHSGARPSESERAAAERRHCDGSIP